MKEKFKDKRLTGSIRVKLERSDHDCGQYWEADKEDIINKIVSITRDFQRQGYKLTLRQLYYQLVSRNYAPNDDTVYGKLSALLDDCRYSGIIDWDTIEDRGRVPYTPYFENDVKGALERTHNQYNLDKRVNQPYYTELWTEKDAISNIIKRATKDYTFTISINKGFTSSSSIYKAYQRIVKKILNKQKVIILYFGDHDPSGLDMVRDIRERLELMLSNGAYQREILNLFDSNEIEDLSHKYPEIVDRVGEIVGKETDKSRQELIALFTLVVVREFFEVQHIGLTMDQVDEFGLPPNPAKLTDPRAKKYVEKYGDISWEVDALHPDQITNIIIMSLKNIIDNDIYIETLEQEEEDKEKLLEFIQTLEDEE